MRWNSSLLVWLIAGALVAEPSGAQSTEEPGVVFNYAFATQLGSGIYRVNGRTVQVYRLAVSVGLRDAETKGWGIRLRFPVTFGFYNFQIDDLLDTGLPDNVATIALVPELEFQNPVADNWWLMPFVGFGPGKDLEGGTMNWIFAVGARSLTIWPWNANDIRLGVRAVYSGYTTKQLDFIDDFSVVETGLDVRRSLGLRIGRSTVDGSVFGANYIYLVSPQFVRLAPEPVDFRTQFEFGFTVGTVEPWRVLGIGMPRLGLSNRDGTGEDAVRIIIGNAFPMDSPRQEGADIQ